jgi:hypothetical protein
MKVGRFEPEIMTTEISMNEENCDGPSLENKLNQYNAERIIQM